MKAVVVENKPCFFPIFTTFKGENFDNISVSRVKVGDNLLSPTGGRSKVLSIKRVKTPISVFEVKYIDATNVFLSEKTNLRFHLFDADDKKVNYSKSLELKDVPTECRKFLNKKYFAQYKISPQDKDFIRATNLSILNILKNTKKYRFIKSEPDCLFFEYRFLNSLETDGVKGPLSERVLEDGKNLQKLKENIFVLGGSVVEENFGIRFSRGTILKIDVSNFLDIEAFIREGIIPKSCKKSLSDIINDRDCERLMPIDSVEFLGKLDCVKMEFNHQVNYCGNSKGAVVSDNFNILG